VRLPKPIYLVVAVLPLTTGYNGRLRDRCLRAEREVDAQKAAAICDHAFAVTGDPRAGIGAARAHMNLGHDDVVLGLSDKLSRGPARGAALRFAGLVHNRRQQLDLARRELGEAFTLDRAAGNHAEASRDAHAIAGLNFRLGAYGAALDSLLQCDAEAEQAGDLRMKSYALTGLATILTNVGDTAAGELALGAAERSLQDRNSGELALLRFLRARLEQDDGRPQLARRTYEEAVSLAQAGRRNDVVITGLLRLIDLALDDEDLASARRWLDALDGEVATRQDSFYRNDLLFRRGAFQRHSGRLPEADQLLDEAERLTSEKELAVRIVYERALTRWALHDVAGAERRLRQSIALVEAMRRELGVRDLQAPLIAHAARPYQALFELLVAQGRLDEAAELAERAQARSFVDAWASAALTRPATNETAATAAHEAGWLLSLLPALEKTPIAEPRPLREGLAALGDLEGLTYFEGREQVFLIETRRGRIRIHPLAIAPARLAELIERWSSRPDDVGTLDALGAALIPPAIRPLRGHVVVVPSAPLSRVNFAALRVDGHWLVEEAVFAHVPSLTALAVLAASGGGGSGSLVMLGDAQGDLPGARSEVGGVATREHGRGLVGTEATSAALRAVEADSVLHLAVHGGVDRRGAWLGLADRDVTSSELLSWHLRPSLVFLASCGSSAGTPKNPWGSASAIWLAAGSRGAIGTLWPIRDGADRHVVDRFYQELRTRAPAEALAETQRALVRDGAPPSEWSVFVYYGPHRGPMQIAQKGERP
jgi:hypothetical protein